MARDATQPPAVRRFQGFQSPNYTIVPDELFDELMVDLTGAELKALLYIIRRTFGFKKDRDNISLSQMLHGVTTRDGRVLDRGVGLSKKTLLQSLRSLEEHNIIITERRQSLEKGNEPTAYRLNVIGVTALQPTPAAAQVETTPPLGEKLLQGELGNETPPSPRGKNSPTQYTDRQHTEISLSNIRKASTSERQVAGAGGGADTGAGSSHLSTNDADLPKRAPQLIGETLARRTTPRGRRVTPSDPARDTILEYITDFSREFADRASLKSSTTRAYNLYLASELPIETFIEGMYRARSVVKERTGSIRGGTPAAGPGQPKSKMAYWFTVLEDLLGLREGASDTT